jgi:hypothetical protein
MKCKNCGCLLRIDPFSNGANWKHSWFVKKEGKKMVCYSITCKCGCTNPEPEKAKKAVGRSEEK